VSVTAADAEVAVDGLGRLLAKGTGSRAAALAHDDCHGPRLELDVLDFQAGELAAPHPGIEQEPDDGVVPAVVEVSARA
jgi:hypothetical protein